MIMGMVIFMITTLIVHSFVPFAIGDFSLAWLPPTLAIFETLLIGYALLFNRFYSLRYIIFQCVSILSNLFLYLLTYSFFSTLFFGNDPLFIILLIALVG